MLSLSLVLAAIVTLALSGVPGCLRLARPPTGQQAAALLMAAGGALGLGGIVAAFADATTPALRVSWVLPWGQFAVTIDPISALFLGPVFVVPALGAIYGLGYWKPSEHARGTRRLGLFYGLLAASMAMVVIARDALLFLMAWEVMAIAAYFAATADEDDPDVRRAGGV
jgi:formate hydrogenlyase subunit 3/multisubunit Na+/H+ antiporter MnhD subunit